MKTRFPADVTTAFAWLLGATVFLTAQLVRADEFMYGVTALDIHNGTLLGVNIRTGESHEIGPHGMGLGLNFLVSLAARPSDGELFADCNAPSFANGLVSVSRATGLATSIGQNNLLNELAFDAKGILYTQIVPPIGGAVGPIGLVNIADGSTTPLSGPEIPRLFGLAYNSGDGFLYGLTFDNLLYKLSTTGQVVSSIQVSSTEVPGAIAFDRNGQLICTDIVDRLFDINLIEGSIGNIRFTSDGSSGYRPQGLAPMIPEPTTSVSVAIALAMLLVRYRIT